MANNDENFKSYAPVVGRMKSKRWVQASNPSYDGDEWGDEYDYDDEASVPEMPPIPEQYNDIHDAEIDEPLKLGTSGEQEKLQAKNSNASTSSKKIVESGIVKYALQDGEEKERSSISRSRSTSLSSRSWGASSKEHSPVRDSEEVDDGEQTVIHDTTTDASSNAQNPADIEDSKPVNPADNLVDNVPIAPLDGEYQHGESSDNEDRDARASGQSDIDDIFDYYASDHESSPLPETAVAQQLNVSGERATAPVAVNLESEAPSSIQPDETADDESEQSEEALPEQEPLKDEAPTRVQGRWKPLPESSVNNVETPLNDRLEKDIMSSFADEPHDSLQVPPQSQGISHSAHPSHRNSMESQGHVDPEMLELYSNANTYLEQKQSAYDDSIQPLAVTKSHDSSLSNTAPSDEKSTHVDRAVAQDSSETEEVNDTLSAHDNRDSFSENKLLQGDILVNEDETQTAELTSQRDDDLNSTIANSDVSPVISHESAMKYQSMIPPDVDNEIQRSEQFGSAASKSVAPRTLPPLKSTQKPPKFDSFAILAKGRSEDRKTAFDTARQQELAYDTGLTAWLADASTVHHGAGVYTSGKPPPPTLNEKQLAAPQRTMSSTFIRPAKHVVSSGVVHDVGEKTTRKAKSLFSKGKRLLS